MLIASQGFLNASVSLYCWQKMSVLTVHQWDLVARMTQVCCWSEHWEWRMVEWSWFHRWLVSQLWVLCHVPARTHSRWLFGGGRRQELKWDARRSLGFLATGALSLLRSLQALEDRPGWDLSAASVIGVENLQGSRAQWQEQLITFGGLKQNYKMRTL